MQIDQLLSQEELLEEIDSLDESDIDYLKRAATENLYFFSKGIVGRPDVNLATHGAFCAFVQDEERRRRLGLMPRTHLKSTIATIDDSARLALQDVHEYRGLIVGETATNARAFLLEIKGHFEKNKLIRRLFPEAIPSRFSGPGVTWSMDQATLNRDTSYRDPTWRAIGVGGAVVGWHGKRIKCDDLIGFESIRSPAKMTEVKEWCGNIEPLLIDQHEDVIDWIGTRWSRTDLYAYLMSQYEGRLAVFTREAIEDGDIIFPEKHTWEEYNGLMTKSPTVWYAQYCNRPIAAGAGDLNVSMVRGYRFSTDGEWVIFRSGGEEKRWNVWQDLDRVICADPNSGSLFAPDFAAIGTYGYSPDEELFVLDSYASRTTPSGFVDAIFDRCRRWHPRAVGIEKAGQQNTAHYFEKKSRAEDFYVSVVPLTPKHRDKDTRIRGAIEPVINSGQLYLLPSQQELREQIATFPDYLVVDELDALGYFPEIVRRPQLKDRLRERKKVVDMVMRRRSRVTGY